MTIKFPHKDEVPLSSPPLIEVVCQVRFPPILQIAKRIPDEFQEGVRHRFPQFEVEQGVGIVAPGLLEGGEPLARATPKIYRFKSEDEKASLSLAMDFYALSHQQYRHWSDFAADLQLAQEIMMHVYQPNYATRIGLRYINRLTLKNTGCESKEELVDLLQPDLTALLRSDIGQNAADMVSRFSFKEEPAQLNMRLAYQESEEIAFVLDFDYFEKGKLPLIDLIERCNQYHKIIYNSFRWSLLDESLQRFAPIVEEA